MTISAADAVRICARIHEEIAQHLPQCSGVVLALATGRSNSDFMDAFLALSAHDAGIGVHEIFAKFLLDTVKFNCEMELLNCKFSGNTGDEESVEIEIPDTHALNPPALVAAWKCSMSTIAIRKGQNARIERYCQQQRKSLCRVLLDRIIQSKGGRNSFKIRAWRHWSRTHCTT